MSFTVGQLAKLTGLTVRALHHYHAMACSSRHATLGLRLSPVRRRTSCACFASGVAAADLSLDEIAAVLAKDGAPRRI